MNFLKSLQTQTNDDYFQNQNQTKDDYFQNQNQNQNQNQKQTNDEDDLKTRTQTTYKGQREGKVDYDPRLRHVIDSCFLSTFTQVEEDNLSIQSSEETRNPPGNGAAEQTSRSASTPAGFRNLRVLIPEELHWKLRDLAIQSRMTFQRYIVSWLGEAFPLTNPPSSSGSRQDEGAAPALGLEGPGQAGLVEAIGTCATQRPDALASSSRDQVEETPKVVPILGRPAGPPLPGPASNLAVAEGNDHD